MCIFDTKYVRYMLPSVGFGLKWISCEMISRFLF